MIEVAEEVRKRALKIKLLVLDCDGVLTDGRIIPLPDGSETKAFDTKDGHGLRMAGRAGLRTAIISGRESFAVRARARDLGITLLRENCKEKLEPFENILAAESLEPEHVCYVGDDVMDLPVMMRAGLAVAVADAVDEIKQIAHLVTAHPGGRGAVRETIELILRVQGRWDAEMGRYRR